MSLLLVIMVGNTDCMIQYKHIETRRETMTHSSHNDILSMHQVLVKACATSFQPACLLESLW